MDLGQEHQWVLTDSVGTRSTFFSETPQNLFQEWSLGLNGFAAGIGDVAEEPKDWLRKLLSDPGLPGRVLRPVVDGIAEVERSARDRRQASVSCPSKA